MATDAMGTTIVGRLCVALVGLNDQLKAWRLRFQRFDMR